MITIAHLTRRYGDFVAVDDVSFSIARGEVVGLLGPNGAGKTTIMKMLTGFLEPTSGSIRVDQLEIGRDTAAIQRRIGYLPENCPAWPEMTVIEFLEYQAVLHDLPAGTARAGGGHARFAAPNCATRRRSRFRRCRAAIVSASVSRRPSCTTPTS